MASNVDRFWALTLLVAALGVALAGAGLVARVVSLGGPMLAPSLLAAGLMATVAAFGSLAVRIRSLEQQRAELIDQLADELERVKVRVESVTGTAVAQDEANARRVPLN